MSENNVIWHIYPDEKPKCESGYIVVFDNYGQLEAKACPWIKGMFTGIKNTLVKAWTEMPYVIGVGKGIMSENKVIWHPSPKEKPKKEDLYLVSLINNKRSFTSYWENPIDKFLLDDCIVTAWAEMPEPYEEE